MAIQFAPAVRIGLHLAANQAQKYLGKLIDEEIIKALNERLESEIGAFLKAIWKRTIEYIFLSLANLVFIVLLVFFDSVAFAVFSMSCSLGFLAYMIFNTIGFTNRALNYLENFESIVKKEIIKAFEEVKSNSLTSKIALSLDTRQAHDYYRLVVDKVFDHLSSWIKENRKLIYIRLGFLVLSSLTFSFSLRSLIDSSLNF